MDIKYAVWAHLCPEPQGRRELWTQDDYRRYEDRFKPEGYTGDRYDQEAWKEHINKEVYDGIVIAFDKTVADNWVAAGCQW